MRNPSSSTPDNEQLIYTEADAKAFIGIAVASAQRDAARWHDQIGAMLDQVGHPDYSLREMCDGLRAIRDEMMKDKP